MIATGLISFDTMTSNFCSPSLQEASNQIDAQKDRLRTYLERYHSPPHRSLAETDRDYEFPLDLRLVLAQRGVELSHELAGEKLQKIIPEMHRGYMIREALPNEVAAILASIVRYVYLYGPQVGIYYSRDNGSTFNPSPYKELRDTLTDPQLRAVCSRMKVVRAIDFLERAGYVLHERMPPSKDKQLRSCIWPTEKLVDTGIFNLLTAKESGNLILLRETIGEYQDAKGETHKIKKDLPVSDSPEVRQTREILLSYQQLMQSADLQLSSKHANHICGSLYLVALDSELRPFDLTNTGLRRIFSENMKSGGRFYGQLQQLPEKVRKDMTIIGRPVVELDCHAVATMTMRLLHGEEVDPRLILNKSPDHDIYLQLAGIAGLQADDRDAIKNLVNARYHTSDRGAIFVTNRDHGIDKALAQAILLTLHEMFPLLDEMSTPPGMLLQYLDSRMLMDVLTDMIKESIPVLPIHDGYLVADIHEQALRLSMISAFEKLSIHLRVNGPVYLRPLGVKPSPLHPPARLVRSLSNSYSYSYSSNSYLISSEGREQTPISWDLQGMDEKRTTTSSNERHEQDRIRKKVERERSGARPRERSQALAAAKLGTYTKMLRRKIPNTTERRTFVDRIHDAGRDPKLLIPIGIDIGLPVIKLIEAVASVMCPPQAFVMTGNKQKVSTGA